MGIVPTIFDIDFELLSEMCKICQHTAYDLAWDFSNNPVGCWIDLVKVAEKFGHQEFHYWMNVMHGKMYHEYYEALILPPLENSTTNLEEDSACL